MSETAQRSAEPLAGPRRSKAQAAFGSLIRRGGTVFLQQREASVFIVAVLLVLYFGFISSASSSFFTKNNIINVADATAPYALLAAGEVFLLICGEIDLSVGFIWTLSPFLMFFFNTYYHFPLFLAIVAALLCGCSSG